MANEELFGALLPALAATIIAFLFLLYVRGIVHAYRAAGEGWKTMDRDVRLVFLLVVPLFRGGIQVLLLADRLFYTPKSETKENLQRQCTTRHSGFIGPTDGVGKLLATIVRAAQRRVKREPSV